MTKQLTTGVLILLSTTLTIFSGQFLSKSSPKVYLVPGVSIDYMNTICSNHLTWSNCVAKRIIEFKESTALFKDMHNDFFRYRIAPHLSDFPKCQAFYTSDLKENSDEFMQKIFKSLDNLVLYNQTNPKINPVLNPFMIEQLQKLANFLQQNIIIFDALEPSASKSAHTCLSALEHELLLNAAVTAK